ncbi:hypothetical protein Efla_001959 [Eimeria flavescens]
MMLGGPPPPLQRLLQQRCSSFLAGFGACSQGLAWSRGASSSSSSSSWCCCNCHSSRISSISSGRLSFFCSSISSTSSSWGTSSSVGRRWSRRAAQRRHKRLPSAAAATSAAAAATAAATAVEPPIGESVRQAAAGDAATAQELAGASPARPAEAPAAAAAAPASAVAAEAGGGTPASRASDLVGLLHAEDLEWPARPPPPFCDFLWVEAKGGRGGSPREGAFRSRALGKGPGYGGHGGSVLLRCSSSVGCLYTVEQRIAAAAGGNAQQTSRGLHAADTIVRVPPGTIVRKRILAGFRSARGRAVRVSVFWQQLLEEGQTLLVAAGGRGGIAPPSLKQQKKRRLPEDGEKVHLELELRLVNDLSVSHWARGLPNAAAPAGNDPLDKRLGMRILRHFFRSRIFLYVLDPTLTDQQQDPRLLLQQQHVQQHLLQQQQVQHQQLLQQTCGDTGNNEETGSGARPQNQHDQQQQQQQQKQQQRQQLEEERLLAVYGELSSDIFCQFLRLRRELRLFDAHFDRKAELVVVSKCDALDRHPLLAVDSLHHRMQHFFPEIPVIGKS